MKSFGWAIHHDAAARVALVDPASPGFAALAADPAITRHKGMRTGRR